MSGQYQEYLRDHIQNVKNAWEWMRERLYTLGWNADSEWMNAQINLHDNSKYGREEFAPYDAYFYGSNRSSRVAENFNRAWLHHIHHNPHHWQHWVLIQDDGPVGALEMPENYVYEMIADWWSFSWKKGNLREIFGWYEENKGNMLLHEKTRRLVETILEEMKTELDRKEENQC